MIIELNEMELDRTLACVQSSLNINVEYEKYARGASKTETVELIKLLQQIEAKLKTAITNANTQNEASSC